MDFFSFFLFLGKFPDDFAYKCISRFIIKHLDPNKRERNSGSRPPGYCPPSAGGMRRYLIQVENPHLVLDSERYTGGFGSGFTQNQYHGGRKKKQPTALWGRFAN